MVRTSFIIALFLASPALADGPSKPGGTDQSPSPPGASLQGPARKLLESERNPEAEMKALLEATATLKLERAVRYRSTVLPPGSYPVAVKAEESGSSAGNGKRSLFIVIGPMAGGAASPPAPAAVTAGKPEDKKSTRRETRSGSAEGSKNGRGDASPGKLQIPLRLSPAPKPSDKVEFSVRPLAKGSKFALQVLAGGSRGRVTFKFTE